MNYYEYIFMPKKKKYINYISQCNIAYYLLLKRCTMRIARYFNYTASVMHTKY